MRRTPRQYSMPESASATMTPGSKLHVRARSCQVCGLPLCASTAGAQTSDSKSVSARRTQHRAGCFSRVSLGEKTVTTKAHETTRRGTESRPACFVLFRVLSWFKFYSYLPGSRLTRVQHEARDALRDDDEEEHRAQEQTEHAHEAASIRLRLHPGPR